MQIKLKKVTDGYDKQEFLNFPVLLNKDNPNYIRPLDQDVEKVFDPQQNKFFKSGICERFLVIDRKHYDVVGRFAVFINNRYQQEQHTGGIGFVDFIDDFEISNFIFEVAKNWLSSKGIEAMDGPINFGEREQWWGLLVEGFHEPLYAMNYNLPYYQKHFERFGFQVYFNQLCFGRKIDAPLSEKFELSHKRLSKLSDINIKEIKPHNLKKFAKDFLEIYNKAWASHGEGKQMNEFQAQKLFKSMKHVIDPRIAFIAYEKEKPIGMWINLPDLNQWFKHYNGKFGFLNKIKFLFAKRFHKNTRAVGLIFGIVPEWQGKGLDGYMIYEGKLRIPKKTEYIDYELQWIGDFNPKMLRIAEELETTVTRKLITYRYLFDRTIPFKRHRML
ncbi:MAG TPA: hypothetical protein PKX92_11480 [Edaphocola sp.]|nr:hypothetical protein [Edaphocola sp.]